MNLKEIKQKYIDLPLRLKASVWFLVCFCLQKGISIIATPIFTRVFTTQEYGELSVFYSWVNIVGVFVTLNIYFGVFVQGLVKFEEDRKKYAASMHGLLTTLSLIFTVVYFLFSDFWCSLFSLSHTQMLYMLILIWANGIFTLWMNEERVLLNYKRYAVVMITFAIVEPVMGLLFIINSNNKVADRLLAAVIVNLAIFSVVFFQKIYKDKTFFSKKYWKYALAFNIPLLPHYLSTVILTSADRIMIDFYIGESAAGIYSLAYSVAFLTSIINSSVMQTVEPWIYEKIKMGEQEKIPRVAYNLIIVVAIVNILLIAFAPEAIFIFAPSDYYSAVWIVPLISMSVYFMFLYMFFIPFEFYYEKKIYITVSTGIAAVIKIVLNLIVLPIFGFLAAGYTTLICYIIYALMHYIFMNKVIKEKTGKKSIYDVKMLIKISIIFMLVSFSFMLTYNMTIIRYSLVAILLISAFILRKKIIEFAKLLLEIKKA